MTPDQEIQKSSNALFAGYDSAAARLAEAKDILAINPNYLPAQERVQDALRIVAVEIGRYLEKSRKLPNDVARCNGVGYQEDDGWDWREGCETCLRRTAARVGDYSMIDPPAIIAFECEFLIEP